MRIRISKLALRDVEEVFDYTVERWGKEQAETYVAAIWESFEKIQKTPHRWRLRDDVYPQCRICFSGRHAVLYRIQGKRVEIGRVLHAAMDFSRHVPSDFMGDP